MASSSRLNPGERGIINATVSTTGRSGPMAKAVVVRSNDPKNPVVTLVLKADVRKSVAQPDTTPQ